MLIALFTGFVPHDVQAQAARYYTRQEVLAYLFAGSDKVDFEKRTLTAAQIQLVQAATASQGVSADWTIYTAHTGKKIDGYAIIDNVKGKDEPITYVVCINPDGRVREVEILQYREAHGGQVKNKSFRKQFVGKSAQSSLRVGQDIQNISGATISSRNLAAGVKRALAVWSVLYQSK